MTSLRRYLRLLPAPERVAFACLDDVRAYVAQHLCGKTTSDPRGAIVTFPTNPAQMMALLGASSNLSVAAERVLWVTSTLEAPAVVVRVGDAEMYLQRYEEGGSEITCAVAVRLEGGRRGRKRALAAFSVDPDMEEAENGEVLWPEREPPPEKYWDLDTAIRTSGLQRLRVALVGLDGADQGCSAVADAVKQLADQLEIETVVVPIVWRWPKAKVGQPSRSPTAALLTGHLPNLHGILGLPSLTPADIRDVGELAERSACEFIVTNELEPSRACEDFALLLDEIVRVAIAARTADERDVLRRMVERMKQQDRWGSTVAGSNHMSMNDLCRQSMPSHLYGLADDAARAMEQDGLLLVKRKKKEGVEVVLNSACVKEIEALLRGEYQTSKVRAFLGLPPL